MTSYSVTIGDTGKEDVIFVGPPPESRMSPTTPLPTDDFELPPFTD